MVMTLTVVSNTLIIASKSGFDHSDRYFLSQGRSIESANKNMYKHLCKEYDIFDFDSGTKDITEFLYSKFSRWQEGKDSWADKESWSNRFSSFTFPRPNRAEIVEISRGMYEKIIEEAL